MSKFVYANETLWTIFYFEGKNWNLFKCINKYLGAFVIIIFLTAFFLDLQFSQQYYSVKISSVKKFFKQSFIDPNFFFFYV